MARLPRLHAPDTPHYLIQRAVPGRALFGDDEDRGLFLALLDEACRRHGFALHAYALATEAVHLLGTPDRPGSAAAVLQAIGRTYVPHVNRRTGRSGALWDRRYRSALVDPGWLLVAMRLVEEAGRPTSSPSWSSLAHHVGDLNDARVHDHARYWALSDTPFERQALYRASWEKPLDPAMKERIVAAVEHGWAVGDAPWLQAIAAIANRRVAPLQRGRRRKSFVGLSPIKAG